MGCDTFASSSNQEHGLLGWEGLAQEAWEGPHGCGGSDPAAF